MEGSQTSRKTRLRLELLEAREVPAVVSGYVYEDANNNGYKEASEVGIANSAVQLKNTSGQVLASTTTNSSGMYSFTGLAAGSYSVCQPSQPTGFLDWKDWSNANWSVVANSVGNDVIPVQLGAADSVSNNFGEVKPGSISGTVFLDLNANGSKNTGEGGLSGITILLLGKDYEGTTIRKTVVTDSNGNFAFNNLRPGNYTLAQRNQIQGLKIGQSIPGSLGGTGSLEQISGISLLSGQNSTSNLFTSQRFDSIGGKNDYINRPRVVIGPRNPEPGVPPTPTAPPIPNPPQDPGTNPNATPGGIGGKGDWIRYPRRAGTTTAQILSQPLTSTPANPVVNPASTTSTSPRRRI